MRDAWVPTLYHPPRHVPPPPFPVPDALVGLLRAFMALDRQGAGPNPWTADFATDPIAFLLDAIQDAVILRREEGGVAYRNRAAQRFAALGRPTVAWERFELSGRRFERRCMVFERHDAHFVIEVISEVTERR